MHLTLALALVAVVLPPVAAAASSGGHHEQARYSGPAGVQDVYRLNGYAQGQRQGAVELPTRASDRVVELRVHDDSGAPVRVEVAQDLSGHGFVTDIASYCSDEVPVLTLRKGGVPLQVYVVAGTCGGRATVPTEGEVAGAFSR